MKKSEEIFAVINPETGKIYKKKGSRAEMAVFTTANMAKVNAHWYVGPGEKYQIVPFVEKKYV